MSVIVSIQCNDYRNGAFLGRCSAVELPQDAIELECRMEGSGVQVSFEGSTMKFWRLTIAIEKHITWYGNWCWDGVLVSFADAVAILNYVKSLKYWSAQGGWCSVVDAWEAGTLTRELLLREYFPYKQETA